MQRSSFKYEVSSEVLLGTGFDKTKQVFDNEDQKGVHISTLVIFHCTVGKVRSIALFLK